MYDVLSALMYCHEEKTVSHHDIKPQNIVIDSYGRAKLCDFGLSLQIKSHLSIIDDSTEQQNEKPDLCGSLYLMSPQMMECGFRKIETYDSYAADIWAFGITFYYLIADSYPFMGQMKSDVYQRQLEYKEHYSRYGFGHGDIFSFLPDDIPDDILLVLQSSLMFNEKERKTARELFELLSKSFKLPSLTKGNQNPKEDHQMRSFLFKLLIFWP